MGAAYLLGGGGMLAWLVFLAFGAVSPVVFSMSDTGRLLFDAVLCLIFFSQHSIMVRGGFRLRLTRTVRADFHGALFAAASGICLLILTGLWQPVGTPLWIPPDWIRRLLILLFLSACIGALWGGLALRDFDPLGVKPAVAALNGRLTVAPDPFIVRGPYGWVRHPQYLFALILIWTAPVFTIDRPIHNALWTIWIIIGATLEERDLVNCFGDDYRRYQKNVPMLVPRRFKPWTYK